MTLIEFFDSASIENVIGALLCEPDHVILIGDKGKQMKKGIAVYQQLMHARGIQTRFHYLVVNKNNLQDIVTSLSHIVENHENCVFDLTGGEDLCLVATGVVMQRYQGQVQCHRFNLQNGVVYDCDADGQICRLKPMEISVEENILIYGGEVVEDEQKGLYTYPWEFDEEFVRDVRAMWSLCRENARLWNAQIGMFGIIAENGSFGDSLSISVVRDEVAALLARKNIHFVCIPSLLHDLEKCGLIYDLTITGEGMSFTFKNQNVKRCLTVAGQVLELTIASRMLDLTDAKGQKIYNDVRVGVVVDWDAFDEDNPVRTINEIDIVAMRGARPIFISCKNGNFDANEIYKLNAVSERFGAKYAKKVLVTTELDKLGDKAEYLRSRMDDMKIRLLEDVDTMDDNELDRVLRSLWSN